MTQNDTAVFGTEWSGPASLVVSIYVRSTHCVNQGLFTSQVPNHEWRHENLVIHVNTHTRTRHTI